MEMVSVKLLPGNQIARLSRVTEESFVEGIFTKV